MSEAVPFAIIALVPIEVLVAAVIDAKERRFPSWLAASMTISGLCCAYALGGIERTLLVFAWAVVVCAPLVGFEILWRRHHRGRAGIGMGDIKFLAAYTLAWPLGAAVSFAGGLVLLALAGLIFRRPSLPLIPFIACASPFAFLAL